MKYVENIIKNIPNNKAYGREILLHILKLTGFIYQMITGVHEKDEATDKENYRPVSVLPLFSNIFEKNYL